MPGSKVFYCGEMINVLHFDCVVAYSISICCIHVTSHLPSEKYKLLIDRWIDRGKLNKKKKKPIESCQIDIIIS